MSAPIPETWDDLKPLLLARPGEWVEAMAWAVGGGDPDGVTIRLPRGRVGYTAAWCVCSERAVRVRLARLEPDGPHIREVVRWLHAEDLVEVRNDSMTGRAP